MEETFKDPNEYWYYQYGYDLKSSQNMKGCFWSFLFCVILGLVLSLCSCQSVRYIPVETVRTEYRNHTDTVLKTDSIFREKETIIREADSSYIARLGLQLKANERAILILQKELEKQVKEESEYRTDTIIKTDSISVPYPVEKQLTKWQQMKMNIGGISLVMCIIFVIMLIVGLTFGLRRK